MTTAVDFDGVIHSYERGWGDGSIYGDFLPNAMAALETLMERDAVFVHTTRNPRQAARWIEQRSGYCIECTTWLPRTWYGRRKPFWNTRGLLLVTDRKLPATVYIDDRAMRFEGDWATTMVALGEPVEHWPTARRSMCDAMSVGGDQCTRDAGHRLHSFEVDGSFEKVRKAIRQARGEYAPQEPIRFGPCNDGDDQPPAYPYQDGDVTVLGPEIFASQDGKAISWKGRNYVPQAAPNDTEQPAPEETPYWYCGAFSPPMPLYPVRCTLPAGHDGHHSDGHGGRWAPTANTIEETP